MASNRLKQLKKKHKVRHAVLRPHGLMVGVANVLFVLHSVCERNVDMGIKTTC